MCEYKPLPIIKGNGLLFSLLWIPINNYKS